MRNELNSILIEGQVDSATTGTHGNEYDRIRIVSRHVVDTATVTTITKVHVTVLTDAYDFHSHVVAVGDNVRVVGRLVEYDDSVYIVPEHIEYKAKEEVSL